jgi:hypothetical protein
MVVMAASMHRVPRSERYGNYVLFCSRDDSEYCIEHDTLSDVRMYADVLRRAVIEEFARTPRFSGASLELPAQVRALGLVMERRCE